MEGLELNFDPCFKVKKTFYQRFPFRRNNLKSILLRPFKFGMWVYMGGPESLLVCGFSLPNETIGGVLMVKSAAFLYILAQFDMQKMRRFYG